MNTLKSIVAFVVIAGLGVGLGWIATLPAQASNSPDYTAEKDVGGVAKRFYDKDIGVVCYVAYSAYAPGISCVKVK